MSVYEGYRPQKTNLGIISIKGAIDNCVPIASYKSDRLLDVKFWPYYSEHAKDYFKQIMCLNKIIMS